MVQTRQQRGGAEFVEKITDDGRPIEYKKRCRRIKHIQCSTDDRLEDKKAPLPLLEASEYCGGELVFMEEQVKDSDAVKKILANETCDDSSITGVSVVQATKLQKLDINSTLSSSFKGVVLQSNGHWEAQIYANHQRIWLGTFKSEMANMFNPNGKELYNFKKLFQKELTPSDVSKLNRLVIPKKFAMMHFCDFPQGQGENIENNNALDTEIVCYDRFNTQWKFRLCYWKSSQSFVFTRGWNAFLRAKKLRAKNTITFYSCERKGYPTEASPTFVIDVKYYNGFQGEVFEKKSDLIQAMEEEDHVMDALEEEKELPNRELLIGFQGEVLEKKSDLIQAMEEEDHVMDALEKQKELSYRELLIGFEGEVLEKKSNLIQASEEEDHVMDALEKQKELSYSEEEDHVMDALEEEKELPYRELIGFQGEVLEKKSDLIQALEEEDHVMDALEEEKELPYKGLIGSTSEGVWLFGVKIG